MAYYTALIAKWGTLSPGTTQQKLDQINAITVTGSVPTSFFTTGDQIANCIIWSEFNALTAAQKSDILQMCNLGSLLGGSTNTTHLAPGMIVAYFGAGSGTVVALSAMASAVVQPWWQATVAQGGGGLSSPVGLGDCQAAGLS